MKVCVVYGVLEERDTGMIVDHYVMTYDIFASKDEADKMVEWLKRKNMHGEFIAEEFEIEKTFNPDNYIWIKKG